MGLLPAVGTEVPASSLPSVSVSKETRKRAINAVFLDEFHVNIKRGFLPSLPPTYSSCVRLNTIIVLIPE